MKPGADVATGGIEDKRKQRKDEDFRTGNAVESSSCYDALGFFCCFFKRSRGSRCSPGPSG